MHHSPSVLLFVLLPSWSDVAVLGLDCGAHVCCSSLGPLPCSWGGCVFWLLNADGASNATLPATLASAGACPLENSTLHLDQKYIKHLAPNVFKGMSGMARLRLNSNEIASLPAGVFNDLRSLTLLSLQYNKLETISSGVLDSLPHLAARPPSCVYKR